MIHPSATSEPLLDNVRSSMAGTTMDRQFLTALLISEPPLFNPL